MISCVNHINIPLGIRSDSHGKEKISIRVPFFAPFFDEFPIQGEFLNAVVIGIRHIDISVCHSDTSGSLELVVLLSDASPYPYKITVRGEFLDTAVQTVRDIDIAVLVQGNVAKFPGAGTFAGPFCDKHSF